MKRCIIVGLPEAGKSTYIGAFWAIEKDGNTGHKLICSKYPEDSTYLDSLKMEWNRQETVNRSSMQDHIEITFELKDNQTGRNISLCIPDFKGERFQAILQNNLAPEVDKWLRETDSVLFFVGYSERDMLQDEIGCVTVESQSSSPKVLTINDISHWTKNIMLLKYIVQNYNIRKFSICISAWDRVDMEIYATVEDWLRQQSAFLLNYIKENIPEYKLFGVSAQGLNYNDRLPDESIENIQERAENHQRAYVFEGEKIYDITEPLYYLLS